LIRNKSTTDFAAPRITVNATHQRFPTHYPVKPYVDKLVVVVEPVQTLRVSEGGARLVI
jgi:hypothetical protein